MLEWTPEEILWIRILFFGNLYLYSPEVLEGIIMYAFAACGPPISWKICFNSSQAKPFFRPHKEFVKFGAEGMWAGKCFPLILVPGGSDRLSPPIMQDIPGILCVYCKMGDHMLSSTCCQNQKKCPWDSFLLDPFFPFPERASFWKAFQTHLEIQAWLPLEYASEDSSAFFHQTQNAKMELPLYTQVIICTKHQWITHIIPVSNLCFPRKSSFKRKTEKTFPP